MMEVHYGRTVYILGAGFSFDAGMPLVSDFLNRRRDSGSPSTKAHQTLITFNYDLVLEDALKRLGTPWDYGFESTQPALGSVPILKLHGSINWSSSKVYDTYSVLRAAGELPHLVPPTWKKAFEGRTNSASSGCSTGRHPVSDRRSSVTARAWRSSATPIWRRS
jgi:hypothetical protein